MSVSWVIPYSAFNVIESWLSHRFSSLRLPGLAVAIMQDGKEQRCWCYGYADCEKSIPLTPEHYFRIASHSKTFTATAVMQLVERGVLNLDQPVARYLPWLSSHADSRMRSVTLRHLLSHGSGLIRDGAECSYWSLDRDFPDYDVIRMELSKQALVISSACKMKYSNYGFSLLGSILEEVTGKPYTDYITKNILQILNLQDTGPEYVPHLEHRFARAYSRLEYQLPRRLLKHVSTRGLISAVGYYSTVRDLCRYFSTHFLDSGLLLTEESKLEMQTPQWILQGCDLESQYGLGLSLGEVESFKLFGHCGFFPGHTSSTFADGANKIVVSVMVNCIDGDARSIIKGIYLILDFFKANSESDVGAPLQRYCGRFVNLFQQYDIVSVGNKLFGLNLESSHPIEVVEELEVVNESTLKIAKTSSYCSEGEEVRFEYDANGVAFQINYCGMPMLNEISYRAKTFLPE